MRHHDGYEPILFAESCVKLREIILIASDRAKRLEEIERRRLHIGHRRALARRELERWIVADANRCAASKERNEASALVVDSPIFFGGSRYGAVLHCEARIFPGQECIATPPLFSAHSESSRSIHIFN